MLIKGLTQVLNYDWHLENKSEHNSLVKHSFSEMLDFDDSWRVRVERIKQVLELKTIPTYVSANTVAKQVKSRLHSLFDRFWIEEINKVNIGADGEDHNKLWFYKNFENS